MTSWFPLMRTVVNIKMFTSPFIIGTSTSSLKYSSTSLIKSWRGDCLSSRASTRQLTRHTRSFTIMERSNYGKMLSIGTRPLKKCPSRLQITTGTQQTMSLLLIRLFPRNFSSNKILMIRLTSFSRVSMDAILGSWMLQEDGSTAKKISIKILLKNLRPIPRCFKRTRLLSIQTILTSRMGCWIQGKTVRCTKKICYRISKKNWLKLSWKRTTIISKSLTTLGLTIYSLVILKSYMVLPRRACNSSRILIRKISGKSLAFLRLQTTSNRVTTRSYRTTSLPLPYSSLP